MAILVTGGAGYIGSHTVRELIDDGRNVIVYDDLSRGHRQSVKDVPLIEGDLSDYERLKETMLDYDIHSVIHFAADSQVGESMANPEKYYYNNVVGTLSLLKAMKDCNVDKIVFSSSAATYGEPPEVPITEKCPQNPTSVYGKTKLMMEQILVDYDVAYGIKHIALRYFNVAGAHVSGTIGEDHTPETHLIPLVIDVALGKRDEIKIFGTNYPTPDGTCIRDYIHVTDLAKAHVLSLDWLINGGPSRAYNLGNGKGFSVREIIETVKKVTGREIPSVESSRRLGDPAILVASSEKIMDELGWMPRYNTLYEIIETAWIWHSKNPNGFEDLM